MNWQLKSAIQRACGAIPFASEALYYFIQRNAGSLRNPQPPDTMLHESIRLMQWLPEAGLTLKNSRILEVGTGRRVDMPLGFFLGGASEVHTVDLHHYLKDELVEHSIEWIGANPEWLREQFASSAGKEEFERRYGALSGAKDCGAALKAAHIRYHAPADAARMPLPDGSIDVHTSYTVFEHIPYEVLKQILIEARRLLSPEGVVLHHIDPSDHFAHDDPAIPSIHFLRFSERDWARYAGNQFAYHNRLRVDAYRTLFEETNYEILQWQEWRDENAVAQLSGGFPLAEEFRGVSPEVLTVSQVRVMARPRR